MGTPKITICWEVIIPIFALILVFGVILPVCAMKCAGTVVKAYYNKANSKTAKKAKIVAALLSLYSNHRTYAQHKDIMNMIIATIAYLNKEDKVFLDRMERVSTAQHLPDKNFWLAIYYFDVGQIEKAQQTVEQHKSYTSAPSIQQDILQAISNYKNGDMVEAQNTYSELCGDIKNPILFQITNRIFNYEIKS